MEGFKQQHQQKANKVLETKNKTNEEECIKKNVLTLSKSNSTNQNK